MEIVAYADGTVHVDSRTAGQWAVAPDRTRGTFEIQGVGVRFAIGSISGGYTVEIKGRPLTPLTLVYTWRDGYDIEPDNRVDFTDARISAGGRRLAEISWTSLYVRIRCVELQMPDVVPYAALATVNHFFRNRTGPFDTPPHV